MSGSIRLHDKLGVNARMTTCDICGSAASIVLLGAASYVDTCSRCGAKVYGGISYANKCPKCGCDSHSKREDVPEHQRQLPIGDRCGKCREKTKTKIAMILVDGEPPKFKGQRLGPVYFVEEAKFVETFGGEVAQAAVKSRAAFMPMEVWQQLGLPTQEECEKIVEGEKEGGVK